MSTADTALSPGAPVLVGEADTGQLGDFGKALEEPAGGAGGRGAQARTDLCFRSGWGDGKEASGITMESPLFMI